MKVRLLAVGAMVLLGGTAFLLLEGASSAVLAFRDARPVEERVVAESRHTMYDTLLGWVNEPDVDIPDLYGPGRHFRTNERGFRAEVPTPTRSEFGRRIICAGDSFALGYGVANDETWCHLLQGHLPDVVTVNMGQGGYGVDQAFLWYMRDGQSLEHAVVLLAVITDDFRRMQSDNFLSYPKPLLVAGENGLEITNVPVPPPNAVSDRVRYWRSVASGFKLIQLIRRIGRKAVGPHAASMTTGEASDTARAVVLGMIRALRESNQNAGRQTIIVYLPTKGDYLDDGTRGWRAWLDSTTVNEGLLFFDLIPVLRQLPRQDIRRMFIQYGELDYYGAAGHYTAFGNAWVASALAERLAEVLELDVRD